MSSEASTRSKSRQKGCSRSAVVFPIAMPRAWDPACSIPSEPPPCSCTVTAPCTAGLSRVRASSPLGREAPHQLLPGCTPACQTPSMPNCAYWPPSPQPKCEKLAQVRAAADGEHDVLFAVRHVRHWRAGSFLGSTIQFSALGRSFLPGYGRRPIRLRLLVAGRGGPAMHRSV